ncbi:MAG TPA: radical SAM protein [Bacteroidales bacterium]|nr:radical SAM protein [Bacteroidales bacterium]
MEKVLFIDPPHITFEDFINPPHNVRVIKREGRDFGSVLSDMPIGILSISSFIKKHCKVETRLIDFNIDLNTISCFEYNSFYDYVYSKLNQKENIDYNPSVIGISVLFTPSYEVMFDVIASCRKIFPKSLIVAGGGIPTNLYRQIFDKTTDIDALCFGEGELPFLELLKADHKKELLENHSSWITKNKIENNCQFSPSYITDLDEIPFYDYDLCDMDSYGLNPAITAYAGVSQKSHNVHVMTSRGCTFKCCFCSSYTVHGREMRYFSIDRIKEDFTKLKEKYNAKVLVFQDDHLMADKKRVYQIIEIVKELKINVVFQNGLALYALDREMLKTLKDAGIDQLLLSVESGNERVLKEIMHKPLNLNIVRDVVNNCRDLGIYTNTNILIGLPGETKEDIEVTRSFLKTIDSNWYLIFCANPLVGSEMYDICVKKKYLKSNFNRSDYKLAVVETEDFSSEYIQEKAYLLNLELNFVLNSDFRLGNYKTALKGFENAIRAKNNHALAYYMTSKCYEKLDDPERAEHFMKTAKEIVAKNDFWKKHFDYFNITLNS